MCMVEVKSTVTETCVADDEGRVIDTWMADVKSRVMETCMVDDEGRVIEV